MAAAQVASTTTSAVAASTAGTALGRSLSGDLPLMDGKLLAGTPRRDHAQITLVDPQGVNGSVPGTSSSPAIPPCCWA